MRWWTFLLVLLIAAFIAFWIGHQGHVGLGASCRASACSRNGKDPWMMLPLDVGVTDS